MTIEIFFGYAHEDEALLKHLKSQLRPLQRQGLISIMWHDRDISAGIEWAEEIDKHLNTAHIILLLVSPDFIDSDYCYSVEMQRALERHDRGEARVIPIILRPCLWQETSLGRLQVLPLDGKPVTSWSNQEEAFFDAAKGVHKVIKEVMTQLLARKISLFGYETDGGTNSVLWKKPLTFSIDKDKDYALWWSLKRNFTREEIVGHTWTKVSSYGDYWTVHFLADGSLTEGFLSDPNRRWQGSWKLIDGMLRINIGRYEIDVFANRENSIYSAIEFESDQKEPFAYHVFFPCEEAKAKHWDLQDAFILIDQIYEQVLNRQTNSTDFILFGSLLHRGEKSVRDVVKLLGLSLDYRERFISAQTTDEAIEICYKHFLGRKADDDGKLHYVKKVKMTGFDAIIVELIDSGEYKREFGEDIVPSSGWLETNVSSIRIGLSSPRPMASVHESPISARGRVEGLDANRNYFIIGYVITNLEYEQGRAPINGNGAWTLDRIYLGARTHRLFFRILDENDRLIAQSKETTIYKS